MQKRNTINVQSYTIEIRLSCYRQQLLYTHSNGYNFILQYTVQNSVLQKRKESIHNIHITENSKVYYCNNNNISPIIGIQYNRTLILMSETQNREQTRELILKHKLNDKKFTIKQFLLIFCYHDRQTHFLLICFLSVSTRNVIFLVEKQIGCSFFVVLDYLVVADWFYQAIVQSDPPTTTWT